MNHPGVTRHSFPAAVVLLLLACPRSPADSPAANPATVDGLIFHQDFDHQGVALCGDGWGVRQELSSAALVPGRFGQGYRFERPRTNWLSPNQASAESGTDGFRAAPGVELSTAAAETRFGRHVLRAKVAAPGLLWQVTPVSVQVQSLHRPSKVFLFSAYLRAERPGVKVRLSLTDEKESGNWQADVAAAERKAQAKSPKSPSKPPVDTLSVPGTATLDATWQRVAARLEVDARRTEQSLVATLELLDAGPATVLADGLQLEQACVYPLTSTEPTSWLPGGQSADWAWIDLPVGHTGLTGRRGTLACWVRPLPAPCGGTREIGPAVTIGVNWWASVWQLGGRTWYAGQSPTKQPKGKLSGVAAEKRLLDPGTHDGWHHLVLAWDEHEASSYLDGQSLATTPLVPGEPSPGAILRLGGSFLEHMPLTGDLDEVSLYARRLAPAEIVALAEARAATAERLPRVLLRRPVRSAFLRSEPQARLSLEPIPYGSAPTELSLSARVPALGASLTRPVRLGQAVELTVKPWLSRPGKCPWTVELWAGRRVVRATGTLEVFEEPSTPEFIIYAWGGTDPDLEERGFNCLFGEPESLLRRGLWAITRIDVRDPVPHPWSPETRAKAEPIARRVAMAAMAHPNVRACLVNSEAFHPPIPAEEPWFRAWMKAETGLDQVPAGVKPAPFRVEARSDADVPAILPERYPAYRFLRWWTARGQGYYLLNQQLARWMRAAGLKTTYYTDQPEVPAQFEAMDLVDFWGYPKSPEGLVARFSHASCMARLVGKPFQAMPGTIYWDDGGGLWLNQPDGKRKVLCLSPDCLKENLWISVACPTVSVGLYGLGERHTELYDPACDAAMTEAYRWISPVGVLVGGLPTEQAPVAMLETDGLWFTQPGLKMNWIRHWLRRQTGRVLARARVPFDWITDDHVAAGWLSRYQRVVVPGAWALPEATHRALVAYARSGGQVIADRVMRAEIPGMQRLNIQNQDYADDVVQRELGDWARSTRDALSPWATVQPAESVFTYTREAGPARYLFVVNDHRQSGPQYQQWHVMLNALGRKPLEPLRDQGLAQDVDVTVPAGMALYDVLKHQRLAPTAAGAKQRVSVHLEPGWAAVIAALPRAIEKVALTLPDRLAPGADAQLQIRVQDNAGQPGAGRQLAEIRVTAPDARPWPGVQRYRRIVDGRLSVPLRLPLTADRGTWRVEVVEWLSGLRAEKKFVVN
jgi:hypothetical protein